MLFKFFSIRKQTNFTQQVFYRKKFRKMNFLLINILLCFGLSFINCYKIEPKIISDLSQNPDQRIDILISLKNSNTRPVLRDLARKFQIQRTSKFVKPSAVYSELKYYADQTQGPILDQIYNRARVGETTVQSLWIVNKILVRRATRDLIENVSQMPNVEFIEEDKKVEIDIEPFESDFDVRYRPENDGSEIQWGVRYVGAPQVWDLGYEGQGVTVGILDSGVKGSHPDLLPNFVGLENNGWFDSIHRSPYPDDQYSKLYKHGTHVTGTVMGLNGYGVAPKAKWNSCGIGGFKDSNVTVYSALLICGQHMLCPTRPDGTQPDCSKAPQVINNSWGLPEYTHTFYEAVISAWKTAGIIPVFASGNKGPDCESLTQSLSKEVIAVGSISQDMTISVFSSRGPTNNPGGKETVDILGPGKSILSTYINSEGYKVLSGTSMAAPHVTGVIALMLSKNPNLTYDQVKDIIEKTANQNLTFTGESCGGISDSQFPNYMSGYGMINAVKAMNSI